MVEGGHPKMGSGRWLVASDGGRGRWQVNSDGWFRYGVLYNWLRGGGAGLGQGRPEAAFE